MNYAPPAVLREEDYEAIEAAVMETARGRWFLAEFARRNRAIANADVLEAVGRVERLVAEAASPRDLTALREVVERALGTSERAGRETTIALREELSAARGAIESSRADLLARLGDTASPRELAALRSLIERVLAASVRDSGETLASVREELAATRNAVEVSRSDVLARLSETASPRDLAVVRGLLERMLEASGRDGGEGLAALREELAAARGAIEAARSDLLARFADTASPRDLAALQDVVERAVAASERGGHEALAAVREELSAARAAVDASRADVLARFADTASPRDLAALQDLVERALAAGERSGGEALAGMRDELAAARGAIEASRTDLIARLADTASPRDLAPLQGMLEQALAAGARTGRELVGGLREELAAARNAIEAARADLLARIAGTQSPRDDLAALRGVVERALATTAETSQDLLSGLRDELAATRSAIEGTRAELLTRLGEAAGPGDLSALREAVERVTGLTEEAGRAVVTAIERIEQRLASTPAPLPAEAPPAVAPTTAAEAAAPAEAPVEVETAARAEAAPAPAIEPEAAAGEPAPAAVIAQPLPDLHRDGDDDLLEPIEPAPAPLAERHESREPPPPPARGLPMPISIGSSALALEAPEPFAPAAPKLERLDFAELSFAEKAALFS